MNENRCVCCGTEIPEGRHICIKCERKASATMEQTEYIPKGWVCPVCKRVYAPDWPFCTACGPESMGETSNMAYAKRETPIRERMINWGEMQK